MKPIKAIYTLTTPEGDVDVSVSYHNITEPEIVDITPLFHVDMDEDYRTDVKTWIEGHFDECVEKLTAEIIAEEGPDEFDINSILDNDEI